jgi:hypothetical protein
MVLPALVHDFRQALIDRVVLGPRRAATIWLAPLIWEGAQGKYGEPVAVRFGAIQNYAEVSAFFSAAPHQHTELTGLRYAEGRRSKPGRLFFELAFERTDRRLVVQCGNLHVGGRTE